jgi:hypothetical protein
MNKNFKKSSIKPMQPKEPARNQAASDNSPFEPYPPTRETITEHDFTKSSVGVPNFPIQPKAHENPDAVNDSTEDYPIDGEEQGMHAPDMTKTNINRDPVDKFWNKMPPPRGKGGNDITK